LLGDEEYEATYGHLGSSTSSTSSSDMRQAVANEATTNPPQGADDGGTASSTGGGGGGGGIRRSGGWPVLMDMDGGREVHALQVSLLCHISITWRYCCTAVLLYWHGLP
jgi:hypothetical protein